MLVVRHIRMVKACWVDCSGRVIRICVRDWIAGIGAFFFLPAYDLSGLCVVPRWSFA